MRQLKKGLAMFLATLMLVSTTSVVSYAQDTIVLTEPEDSLTENGTVETEVIYILDSQEITVGYDAEQALATPSAYKLFDEGGSYTIQVEDNALFPYEMKFKFGEMVSLELFDTPESIVHIGGHDFSVYSEQNDDVVPLPSTSTFYSTNLLAQQNDILDMIANSKMSRALFASYGNTTISNQYIEVAFNEYGHFTMGTSGTNSQNLLFGHPYADTSYTTIQIDGENYIFLADEILSQTATSCSHRMELINNSGSGSIFVTQTLSIVSNNNTGRNDTVKVTYDIENRDVLRRIGLRIMMDTQLGSNDGAPFRVPGYGSVTKELELSGQAVPNSWNSFDDLDNPSIFSTGTLYTDIGQMPDKIQFASWRTITGNRWDYIVDSNRSVTGDSAVAIYWNPVLVAPGSTRHFSTCYGLGEFSEQFSQGNFSAHIASPAKLNATTASGVSQHSPNPFVVTAYIKNTGSSALTYVRISPDVPQELTVLDSDSQKSIGSIAGGVEKVVSYEILANPVFSNKTVDFSLSINSTQTGAQTIPLSIELPALPAGNIVSFNSNGGTQLPPLVVSSGSSITSAPQPRKVGYLFLGWYSDSALTNPATFPYSPTGNITLYAKWGIEYTDSGLQIIERIGNRDISTGGERRLKTNFSDEVFTISGAEPEDLIAFYFNGDELIRGTDYTVGRGSTKITVRSQTFQKYGEGSHTIAADFQSGQGTEVKRAAQTFTVQIPSTPSTSGPSSGSSSSSGGSSSGANLSTSKPAPAPTPAPTPSPAPQEIISAPEPIVIKIEVAAVIENGKATVEISPEVIAAALADAIEKMKDAPPNSPIVLELVITGLTPDVTDVNVSIPAAALESVAGVDNASLKITAGDLGTIILNNTALNSIASQGGESVGINISREGYEATVGITVDKVTLDKIDGGIRVAFPNLADGEVIVLIKTDNGDEIVKKSVVESNNVFALLDGSGTVKVINNSKKFSDVKPTDWFNNSILFASSRELFVGIDDTDFAPAAPMTRAMLAVVLHRLENNKNAEATRKFPDVPDGHWYSDGISWAASSGIISGYEDGSFGANNYITREQLAAMMYRYANHIGVETIERGNTQQFSDAANTSPWANDAVRWAVGIGLLQGDGSKLNPQGQASRAEVAAIVMRFVELLVK